ncbi:hypothetical protein B0H13DRAFT_1879697 [Mycena leptocephala]|nr:hypothetical protein B0H13DRAFT_1879697 [Mycena leptocephala]
MPFFLDAGQTHLGQHNFSSSSVIRIPQQIQWIPVVSSNGPNWVQALRDTFNVAGTKVLNLASGGATIDSALVTPFEPTVLSIVDQVAEFKTFLRQAGWRSMEQFQLGNAFSWTNTTQPAFNKVLMNRLTTQLDELYSFGARSFLFLTVPPVNRAPLFLEQGKAVTSLLASDIANYNAQLSATAKRFQESHKNVETTVFDTQPVFNTFLDNAKTFGFSNSTGFCEPTKWDTCRVDADRAVCTCLHLFVRRALFPLIAAATESQSWLNSLHPLFTVHNAIAHAIATVISA